MASTSKFSLVARLATLGNSGNLHKSKMAAAYFLKFWDPLNISETAKARNLKFGVLIDYDACY